MAYWIYSFGSEYVTFLSCLFEHHSRPPCSFKNLILNAIYNEENYVTKFSNSFIFQMLLIIKNRWWGSFAHHSYMMEEINRNCRNFMTQLKLISSFDMNFSPELISPIFESKETNKDRIRVEELKYYVLKNREIVRRITL